VLYGWATALAGRMLAFLGASAGRFRWLPLASEWTRYRDFPAPQGKTFQAQWKRRHDRG
jgi:L-lactate dehydrogenase complex protein LldF